MLPLAEYRTSGWLYLSEWVAREGLGSHVTQSFEYYVSTALTNKIMDCSAIPMRAHFEALQAMWQRYALDLGLLPTPLENVCVLEDGQAHLLFRSPK